MLRTTFCNSLLDCNHCFSSLSSFLVYCYRDLGSQGWSLLYLNAYEYLNVRSSVTRLGEINRKFIKLDSNFRTLFMSKQHFWDHFRPNLVFSVYHQNWTLTTPPKNHFRKFWMRNTNTIHYSNTMRVNNPSWKFNLRFALRQLKLYWQPLVFLL